MKYLLKPVMALVFLISLSEAKEFVIDNAHSNIGFSVKHMMISNVKGSFNAYTADIDFDAEKKINEAKAQVLAEKKAAELAAEAAAAAPAAEEAAPAVEEAPAAE